MNELLYEHDLPGVTTLYGIIRPAQDFSKRWDGAALTPDSSIADADWANGVVSFTGLITATGTAQPRYAGSWPEGLVTDGDYVVVICNNATPAPTDAAIGAIPVYVRDGVLASVTAGVPEVNLTPAYDAAKSAASQSSLDALSVAMNASLAQIYEAVLAIDVGGTASVIVTPLSSTVSAGEVSESDLTAYQHAKLGRYVWIITDSDGNHVDLSGKAITIVFYDPHPPYTTRFSYSTDSGEVVISGTNHDQVELDADDEHTAEPGILAYVVRNSTDDTILARGTLTIVPAADA